MANGPLPVLCLGGPTGSGKTALALALAKRFGCEIINADSRQVYADFPILTAQPSGEEKRKIPHHLYGFLPSWEKISAGQWIEMASRKAREILERGNIPLLVGGTGLYFQALLRGIADIPEIEPSIGHGLQERMKGLGPEAMHGELAEHDPEYSAKVHPRDRQRILRALEVFYGTGRPFSWWHKNAMRPPLCKGPLAVLDGGLDWLAPRLAARIEAMLEGGALEEAGNAFANCPDAGAPGWSGIGCAELLAYARGEMNREQCRTLWLANTRAYAKRQLTWFRQRREAVFFRPDDPDGLSAFFQKGLDKSFCRHVKRAGMDKQVE